MIPSCRRIFGAHAPHLAAQHLPPHEICDFAGTPGLRSSLTHSRMGSLRSSAQAHDLGHLASESLAAIGINHLDEDGRVTSYQWHYNQSVRCTCH